MLSSLIAVLLAAAPDSLLAKPNPDPVADSIALEKASPLPQAGALQRTEPNPAARHAGPLVPQSFGVGFKVLGNAPKAELLVALDRSSFVRLVGSYSHRNYEDRRTQTSSATQNSYSSPTVTSKLDTVPTTSTNLEFSLEVGRIHHCLGNLCASSSLGPMFANTIQTSGYSSVEVSYTERTSISRFGVSGSTGLRWQFHESLSLVADITAHYAGIFGGSSNSYRSQSPGFGTEERTSTGKIRGNDLGVEFGGVGLTAWF